MSVSVPISPGICKALARCDLSRGTVGLWEIRLLGEIERYCLTKYDDQPDAAHGDARIKGQINGLHRSLKRSIRATALQKHWDNLDPVGKIFVNMKLRMAEGPDTRVEDLDFADPVDRKKLETAAAAARKWLGDKPGSEHSSEIRALAAAVASVYRIATQKEPGISSTGTAAGPNYATPFENLLVEVMTEAGEPMSIEAARNMYRSRCHNRRPKPKK
jgi:hypothetical protein